MITQNCRQCSAPFQITDEDLNFYEKISPEFQGIKYQIPLPTFCPECRVQRRLIWRNERKLYHCKCDLTGKQIISLYSPNEKFTVYGQDAWWSDKWDPLEYSRDFDFSKPFFEQFAELLDTVPKLGLINKNCENSDYSLFSSDLKNCYLVFSALKSEDCYYAHQCNWSRDCMDVSFCYESELCYETVDSKNCYACAYIQNCDSCKSSRFCYGCQGCSDCFLCVNLVNKQYCINNVQYTKEEYEKKIQEYKLTHMNVEKIKKIFEEIKLQNIHRFAHLFNCENCTGDYLRDCKNCLDCFDLPKSEDAKYIWTGIGLKDCMDCCYTGRGAETCYECLSAFPGYHELFTSYCWESSELMYSDHCFNSNNLFGCVGLKKKQYCILNKQYTKEEYEALVPRIIEHMQKTMQWGEFFPGTLSPYGYNETVANEYFPLTQNEAEERGYSWQPEEAAHTYSGPKIEIPDDINDVHDDITEKILTCEVTGKFYKIIPQELSFYRKMGLPISRKCPEQRHKERMALRNSRILFSRTCGNCNSPIQTTYSTNRPEIIYCEKCYLDAIY